MAKEKKTKGATPRQERNYITTRARKLPLGKCYVTSAWKQLKEATIIVTREHPQGTITAGIYLVDLLARGCWNTFYIFNKDRESFMDFLSDYNEHSPIEEADYNFVHNMIYGAIEYAEGCGIAPCEDFDAVTEYLLEEDTDEIPIIEFEYGENGRPMLVVENKLQASMYEPLMRKALGPDGYDLVIGGEKIDPNDAAQYDREDMGFSEDLKARGEEVFAKYLETNFNLDDLRDDQQIFFHFVMGWFLKEMKDKVEHPALYLKDYLEAKISVENLESISANFSKDAREMVLSLLDKSETDPDNSLSYTMSLLFFSSVYRVVHDEVKKLSVEKFDKMKDKGEKFQDFMEKTSKILTRRIKEINKTIDGINDAVNAEMYPGK